MPAQSMPIDDIHLSVSKRLNVLARGFGGHRISGLLERIANTRARKVKQVTILIGINDCLSTDFDIIEPITAYEKFVYTRAHKFTPEKISICTLLQLGAFRHESNVSVNKFNKQLCSLVSKVEDLYHTKLNLIDLNVRFQNNLYFLKAIVKSLRNNLMNLNVEISRCAISFRPKQNRQTPRPSQKHGFHIF